MSQSSLAAVSRGGIGPPPLWRHMRESSFDFSSHKYISHNVDTLYNNSILAYARYLMSLTFSSQAAWRERDFVPHRCAPFPRDCQR